MSAAFAYAFGRAAQDGSENGRFRDEDGNFQAASMEEMAEFSPDDWDAYVAAGMDGVDLFNSKEYLVADVDLGRRGLFGGLEGGGSAFVGIGGISINTGVGADIYGNACHVTTACVQFGLGFFGGAGVSGNMAFGQELQSGTSDSWGFFGNAAKGAAAGGSLNFSPGTIGGARGFYGGGVGASGGVQFCRNYVTCP